MWSHVAFYSAVRSRPYKVGAGVLCPQFLVHSKDALIEHVYEDVFHRSFFLGEETVSCSDDREQDERAELDVPWLRSLAHVSIYRIAM
jgi:hypothetical protein